MVAAGKTTKTAMDFVHAYFGISHIQNVQINFMNYTARAYTGGLTVIMT